jgi:hypothetical protein
VGGAGRGRAPAAARRLRRDARPVAARFGEPDLPDVVYLEQLTSALYLDKPEAIDSYLLVMERVCMEAATPAASAKIIKDIMREY